jgi:hypothetical protein
MRLYKMLLLLLQMHQHCNQSQEQILILLVRFHMVRTMLSVNWVPALAPDLVDLRSVTLSNPDLQ